MTERLRRNTRDAMLAGVAAGFADHFHIDPLLVRLAFVCLFLCGGSGFLLYVICWILMPRDVDLVGPGDGQAGGDGSTPADRMAREAGEAGQRVVDSLGRAGAGRAGRAPLVLGLILIVVGLAFLMDRFLPIRWFWIWDLWPLALVALGLLMLLNALRGGNDARA